MITHTNRLNVVPGGTEDQVVINLSQYDVDFTLVFQLFATGATLTIESGTTAKIQGKKGQGGSYEASATLDAANKTVTVTGSRNLTNERGTGTFELCLTHSGRELHTTNFNIIVEKAPTEEAA